METEAGSGGTPFSLAAPLTRVIFSFCLPQLGLPLLGSGAVLDWDFQRSDLPGIPLSWARQVVGPPVSHKCTSFGV